MLDEKGFDRWADNYDEMVKRTSDAGTYPFAGYQEVLKKIHDTVCVSSKGSVLDIGFGTAALTARLYAKGFAIYGQDISSRMIGLAQEKMPGAHLYKGDFAEGLAKELDELNYDFIIATYSLHHLNDEQKIILIKDLQSHLKKDGKILIGDVAFAARKELEECRRKAGEEWDDEEYYLVVEELKEAFPELVFTRISHCAGVISIGAGKETSHE